MRTRDIEKFCDGEPKWVLLKGQKTYLKAEEICIDKSTLWFENSVGVYLPKIGITHWGPKDIKEISRRCMFYKQEDAYYSE